MGYVVKNVINGIITWHAYIYFHNDLYELCKRDHIKLRNSLLTFIL